MGHQLILFEKKKNMECILELEQDSTTTLEGLIMDFSVDLLVFLATLTNIGVISCVIFRVTKFDSGVLLLLQLAGNYIF